MDYTKRTSIGDLYNLCNQLGLSNVFVGRMNEVTKALANKHIQFIIFNLDDYGPGSHWVAISKPDKMYFDSYAQPAPTIVPSSYKIASQKKEIQSISSTDCGALCALWLYYMKNKSNEEYYQRFKDVYD